MIEGTGNFCDLKFSAAFFSREFFLEFLKIFN